MDIIAFTASFVQRTMEAAEGGHDWFHIERVYKNSILIAQEEDCDLTVVKLGALLHDIADSKFNDGDETIGPKTARTFLESENVFEETINHVINIIENISFKGGNFENKFSSNGRLNVYNAVNEMRKFCNEDIISPPLSNEFKIFWSSEKEGVLYFNFDLINRGTPEVFVYDNIGKKIAQFTSYEMEAGNYTQTISLSNLSSGTYFIQLMLNGRLSNTKLFFNH